MRPLDSVGVQARMAADDVDQPKARARTDGRGRDLSPTEKRWLAGVCLSGKVRALALS